MEATTAKRLILLVEDNPDRVQIVADVLRGSAVPHRLVTLEKIDGVMDFLRRQGAYTDAPRPDLILLNLDLSHQDGRALLANIKGDSTLRRIPVVVLTNRMTQAEILSIYTLHGNCCAIAAQEVERLAQIVEQIENFWLGIVTLPRE